MTAASLVNSTLVPESAFPPPRLPPLPTELVLRILADTVPPASHATHAARTRVLHAYALLSRDCARWACLELRRDVRLRTFEHAKWFAREVLRRRGRAWASGIRALRLGEETDQEGQGDTVWRREGVGRLVSELLRLCGNVEELWICGLSGIQPGDLAAGQKLRALRINEARMTPSTDLATPLCLPHLATLYLKAVICTGPSLAQLLNTSVLPALRHVEYHSVHQSLVAPLPPPAPAHGPNAVPGGASNLAAITANLAALRPSAQFSSSSSEHPLCAFATQLRSLVLGDHASRSLPPAAVASLLSGAHVLEGLSVPIGMLLDDRNLDDALDLCTALRALRLTTTGPPPVSATSAQRDARLATRATGWRDAAFDLVTQALPGRARTDISPLGAADEDSDGLVVAAAPPQRTVDEMRMLVRVEAAMQIAVRVLERAGRGGTVTAPAVDAADEWTTRRAVDARGGEAGVMEEREGREAETDGPWRVDGARWRGRRDLE